MHVIQSGVNRILRPLDLALIRARQLHLTQGPITIHLDGRPFLVDEIHFPFWRAFEAGKWDPETRALLKSELRPDDVYYDCGAWLGPTTLYASLFCRQVYAFEPDPIACRFLLENVTNNHLCNVRVFNLALSDHDGTATMSSFAGMLGDSQSSLLHHGGAFQVPVTTVSIYTVLERMSCEPPTFIKMDIEGAEFAVVPSMREVLRRYRPRLYLSTHAPFLPESERIANIRELVCAMDGLYGPIDVPVDDFRAVLLKPAPAFT
jgi:FkbM family methyltransferase